MPGWSNVTRKVSKETMLRSRSIVVVDGGVRIGILDCSIRVLVTVLKGQIRIIIIAWYWNHGTINLRLWCNHDSVRVETWWM